MLLPTSSLPEIVWPAIPGGRPASLLSLLFQLEQSQWWSADALHEKQQLQLAQVVAHAYRTVPFHRERFDQAGLDPQRITDPELWCKLPLLTRRDIQLAGTSLNSTDVPKTHGQLSTCSTSGSTGAPVRINKTAVDEFFWHAITLRDHLWHRRDFRLSLAAIRNLGPGVGKAPEGIQLEGWGGATEGLMKTGPAYTVSTQNTVDEQAEWLQRVNPHYLLSYPSVLTALALRFKREGKNLSNLREARSFGEILERPCRDACQEAWGVSVVDMYSAQETGYISLQCPQSENHHVQSETVFVEVLDADGNPCLPGQIGRIVVTTLHNFATPLLRYEIGDFAEVGGPCPCGRNLPVLKRVLGRQRNLLTLPTGERRWPLFDRGERPDQLPPFHQFQVVQRTLQQIEINLVAPRPWNQDEEVILKRYVQQSLAYPFEVTINQVAEIPRSPAGKFEDFISHVAGGDDRV